ncbi:MAG: YlmC/YmxH family sporulation protein [Oscillospiraceae bacterium]|nr:YlmC/YmxH family sporulation protein [Oscillospiraceae bacterium]
MGMRVTELHCKEVICISDGRRLGFVSDVEVELPSGNVLAVIVPGPCRFFGIIGRNDDYVIPWRCIKRIGPDIILVDIKPDECRFPRPKFGLPFP